MVPKRISFCVKPAFARIKLYKSEKLYGPGITTGEMESSMKRNDVAYNLDIKETDPSLFASTIKLLLWKRRIVITFSDSDILQLLCVCSSYM